jgi:hypothetical protein
MVLYCRYDRGATTLIANKLKTILQFSIEEVSKQCQFVQNEYRNLRILREGISK